LRRNCLPNQVIKGNIEAGTEVTGRQWRRGTELLDDLKERRGYWKLEEEIPYRTLWRTCSLRGYGPVVRQTTERMNRWMDGWINEWVKPGILAQAISLATYVQ
jgi:hypothetical protein